jgi:hypothetical protein
MSEFEDARTRLNDARQAAAAAREAVAAARTRGADASRTSAADLARLAGEAAKAADDFAKVADPRTAIDAWAPATPLLLLPVRLETRFVQVSGQDALWVRIFPDDCVVDSFEADLSDTEFTSGRHYWIEIWAAGGVEAQGRAAWRNLVASHGSGRAAWIILAFAPAAAPPAKQKPEDIILVIATDAAPSDAKKSALADYWKAVWLANGDKQAIDEAMAALSAAPGVADAEGLIKTYAPDNLGAAPAAPAGKGDVAVDLAWLILPAHAADKTRSWTKAARANVMPDCFVVQGWQNGRVLFEECGKPIPSPLIVGPDPSAAADQQMRFDADGNLVVPDDLRWMTDFERAVAVGMGVKIALDPSKVDLGAPIERVLALGLRLADNAAGGQAQIERLLSDHRYSRGGLALVSQGTPTNNTETEGAGYDRGDDADASYDLLFGADAALTPQTNWWTRQDGEWLTDALGIDWRVLDRLAGSTGRDLAEARAMSRALWPATIGYAMETILHPLFGPDSVAAIHWFFTRFVMGRGFLPCLRIGNQPYGVLPTTQLSGWTLPADPIDRKSATAMPTGTIGDVNALAAVLDKARGDWSAFAQGVAHIGNSGDPHQTLLDVLGLDAASVEFHQRFFQSQAQLYNLARFTGSAQAVLHQSQLLLQQQGMQLLESLGYTGDTPPDALSWIARSTSNRLNGPLIDDRPLSESAPVRASASGRNYIAWLAHTARTSFDDLRLENGFDNGAPDALLYVLLRHGLLLGFWDQALQLHGAANALTPAQVSDTRKETNAIHLQDGAAASESRYALLYSRNPQVSGDPNRTVAERISASIAQNGSAAPLGDQLAALDMLVDVATGRLERCFTEHIDTTSYRLDAWLLGLANLQLALCRYTGAAAPAGAATHAPLAPAAGAFGDTRAQSARGIHVGAYGWLENLQKAPQRATPVKLDSALADAFKGDTPLLADPGNAGYMFAPSLTHATTAAILRAGYLSNASPQTPDAFAVDLSSARVRLALDLIDGIRNGQPLGALLGYRLQRTLDEDYPTLGLDPFVQWLRQAFPLVANRMTSTQEGVPVESVEASNVVDGLKLVDYVRAGAAPSYPFGLAPPPGLAPGSAEIDAVNSAVGDLLDAYDAVADLALAESVHQAVLGNYDAVSATLEAYSKGSFPPEPDVVRTPTAGRVITHRVGLHVDASASSPTSGVPGTPGASGTPASPRTMAQPAINTWLAAVLPDPAIVGCKVQWVDPETEDVLGQATVTQADLKLEPIDILYIVTLDGAAAMGELDDRIVRHVMRSFTPRGDAGVTLLHTVRLPSPVVSFFELAPLVAHLRSLLLRSRPLMPSDIVPPGGDLADSSMAIGRERVQAVWDALKDLSDNIAAFAMPTEIDGSIAAVVDLFERAARFGLTQVGWGFLYEWRRRAFADVLQRLSDVVDRWTGRLKSFDQGWAAYTAQSGSMSNQARITALARLDLLVSANALSPRPSAPQDYEQALTGADSRRQVFDNKLTQLTGVLAAVTDKLSSLLAAVQAVAVGGTSPIAAFDNTPFSLADIEDRIGSFKADTQKRIDALAAEIDKRLAAATAQLQVHDSAAADKDRVNALQQTGKALLGDDVMLLPKLTLAAGPAADLAKAYSAGINGKLTQYLRTEKSVDDPVNDWLHGVARVREKLFAFEQASLLSGALRGGELSLTPLQLPYADGQGWLALEFDPNQAIDGDSLLYTAHYPAACDFTKPIAGLLIDEWTEVLPAGDDTAGLAFHFDRPDSEPPQCWLLVTPPAGAAAWKWSDVVAAITDTFDLARLRAVEPSQVETKTYAQFLPATSCAAMPYGVSIAANLARVNNVAAHLMERSNG